jgi:hypothetical protein
MVGILVDAYRTNRAREEFSEIFDDVQALFEENLREPLPYGLRSLKNARY